jgi:2-oxoglutarate dehydrogenase E2 component (dihydrolipoamide succinyltransferase)
MTIEIKAPTFPESISDGTIAVWHQAVGDAVRRDDLLVDIETDKVVVEVVAPADGHLGEIFKQEGEVVLSDEVLAHFVAATSTDSPPAGAAGKDAAALEGVADSGPEPEPMEASASPAARRLADELDIDMRRVSGSGKSGRITKDDVVRAAEQAAEPMPQPAAAEQQPDMPAAAPTAPEVTGERVERRVPMTRLRASIARRLVEAQHNAAMLTTFNEVDMLPVMTMRRRYQDEFQSRHNGTRLGYMSFFVRASVEALKRFPAVNASIDGADIIYHGFYDVGVAVSSSRGLVVPVIRDADALSLAQIEDQVSRFGERAKDGKLSIEDMSGGTFTISNGGIFGSMLSTPILNPPQTAILGMHKIQERAVVVEGEIIVRPMMYLALSYDHRLIDGQEAVRFLVTIKELIEDPARILLEL